MDSAEPTLSKYFSSFSMQTLQNQFECFSSTDFAATSMILLNANTENYGVHRIAESKTYLEIVYLFLPYYDIEEY